MQSGSAFCGELGQIHEHFPNNWILFTIILLINITPASVLCVNTDLRVVAFVVNDNKTCLQFRFAIEQEELSSFLNQCKGFLGESA